MDILSFYKGGQGGNSAGLGGGGGLGGGNVPLIGNQFSITTESDKFLEKLKRKEDRKRARRGQPSNSEDSTSLKNNNSSNNAGPQSWDPKMLRQQREEELRQGALSLESLLPAGSTSDRAAGTAKNVLPQGTVRISKKTHDEVRVPYQKPRPLAEGERLVSITEFDPWAQLAFEGLINF